MTSANGFWLEVRHLGGRWSVNAAWPAPFFALYLPQCPEEGDEPMLVHCETLEHALGHGARGAQVLRADFTEYEADAA